MRSEKAEREVIKEKRPGEGKWREMENRDRLL